MNLLLSQNVCDMLGLHAIVVSSFMVLSFGRQDLVLAVWIRGVLRKSMSMSAKVHNKRPPGSSTIPIAQSCSYFIIIKAIFDNDCGMRHQSCFEDVIT